MKDNRGRRINAKNVVKDKMQVLDDFGICDKHDQDMIEKLTAEIEKHPGKDPREVLDAFCRPMVQRKVNSWV